jgi:hypothetical protein
MKQMNSCGGGSPFGMFRASRPAIHPGLGARERVCYYWAMKKMIALALALVLTAPAARAHVGDTVAQLRVVYGATAKRAGNTLIFERNGYSICVYFDGDVSGMEVFTRDGSLKNRTDITDADIKGILLMEGDGQDWNSVTSKSGRPTWLRADKTLIARLDPGQQPGEKVFVVMINEK